MRSLPGVCFVCRQPVRWGRRAWRDVSGRGRIHACPTDREECGARMLYWGERCARRPGHKWEHRSRWQLDMDAARRSARGARAFGA